MNSKVQTAVRLNSDLLEALREKAKADKKSLKNYIEKLIKESKVEISNAKTETFTFDTIKFNDLGQKRLTSIKINNDGSLSLNAPLIYLGFEYRGFNVVIKSTNLAKFYRRLINIVKRRSKRAINGINKNPYNKKAIYINQIKKIYNNPLREIDSERNDLNQKLRNKSTLQLNDRGDYSIVSSKVKSKRKNSNYMGYVNRCTEIFGVDSFKKQLRKRKHIVYTAIKKHLK